MIRIEIAATKKAIPLSNIDEVAIVMDSAGIEDYDVAVFPRLNDSLTKPVRHMISFVFFR